MDGIALCNCTERCLEILVPVIGDRLRLQVKIKELTASTAPPFNDHLFNSNSSASESLLSFSPSSCSSPPISHNSSKSIASSHESDLGNASDGDGDDTQDVQDETTDNSSTQQSRKRDAKVLDVPVVLNARRPWPAKISLPTNFRAKVTAALNAKQRLCPKLSTMFVHRIYEHFSQYTMYPQKEQVWEIARKIVKDYPFLKDTTGMGSGYDAWFAKVWNKFRNERKDLSDDPEVILHKRAKKGEGGPIIPKALRRGGINWEPPYPEGEDEASMKRHKKSIVSELKRRGGPDKNKVRKRMQLTFPERRRLINGKVSIKDIKKEYPALFDYDQLIEEFETILNTTSSISRTFHANLSQMCDGILKHTAKCKDKCVKVVLSKLDDEEAEDDDTENNIYEKNTVALEVLPLLIKNRNKGKKEKNFIEYIPAGTDISAFLEGYGGSPLILITGTLRSQEEIHIVAENEKLCQVPLDLGVSGAVVALMATYYVFMFKYPPILNEKKTIKYEPAVVEEHHEETQIDQTKKHPEEPKEDQTIENHDEYLPKAEKAKEDDDKNKINGTEAGLTTERNSRNGDVLNMLKGKFKHGYNSFIDKFSKYDPENTGMVSRRDFRQVLSMCRLNLGPVEIEHFLSRFGVREQVMIPYREILDEFEDRTEKGLLQKILEDSKHRFNRSRESDIGNTTAIDAEARILDILHADFLSMLAAFKQLDHDNLGLIKKYQFQEMLDARLGIKLTKDQLNELLKKIGAETTDGLVLYGRFLELFSAQRRTQGEDLPGTTNPYRPSTCPTRPPSIQSVMPQVGVDRSASFADIKKSAQARDVDQLLAEIGHLLTEKFQVINKTFIGIDKISRNAGHLTRETFMKLFERHNLVLSTTEVEFLWKKLPVERDGTLSFIELVKTCFTAAGRTPPRDRGIEHQTKGLSRVLQTYARSHVRKSLEKFQEEEEDPQYNEIPPEACVMSSAEKIEHPLENDVRLPQEQRERPKFDIIFSRIKNEVRDQFNQIKDGFLSAANQNRNTITTDLFTQILLKSCKSLCGVECKVLAQRFEEKTGRIRYSEFLKAFLPTMPEGTDPIASPRQPKHGRAKTYPEGRRVSSNDALHSIMDQIRNKMISDWKALRRTMKKSDKYGDGMIDVSDFKAAMNAFGFSLNEEDFYHIFSAFDVNMDGRISYVAFMKETLV